ncbi:MAG: cytochrome b/b6 domain-containing protein [Pseudomonadota bacterium]
MNDSLPAYPLPIRVLHWLTVILVAGLFALAAGNGLIAEAAPDLGEMLVVVHINLGFFVFLATLARLALRFGVTGPGPSDRARTSLHILARTVHGLLYAGLLAIPVAGYVKLASLGFEIRILGTVPLPGLPFDPSLARVARDTHAGVALCLLGLVVLHAAAAALHHRIDGIPVLRRMSLWPGAGRMGVHYTARRDSR